MTRYFAGNSLAAFARNSTDLTEITTAGRFDSNYVARALDLGGSGTRFAETPYFPAAHSSGVFRVRFDMYWTTSNTTSVWWYFYNSSGTRIAYFDFSSNNKKFFYWNGTTNVDGGTVTMPAINTLHTMQIEIDPSPSGYMKLYANNALLTTINFTSAAIDNIGKIRCYSPTNGGNMYISQVMAADFDLRDSHFAVPELNGNSAANAGGTGAYSDISPPLSDATSVKVTTSGNKQGQTKAAIAVPAGYIIGAMVTSARGRVSGAITDGKLGVRTSGGTNSSGIGRGYNGGYEPRQRIIETDPDTATEFTQTGFNNAEVFLEAA